MANATQERTQVSPEDSRQALLAELASLEGELATSVKSQAEFSCRIAESMGKMAEACRVLIANLSGTKAAAEDAGGEATRQLTSDEQAALFSTLQDRLGQKPAHYTRPEGIVFADVRRALEANPAAMWSIAQLERTGGEPDIVEVEDGAFTFADCSAESPAGRRGCVYDEEAEKDASGSFYGNAAQMAGEFGVKMWSEDFNGKMRKTGKFDTNSYSWLQTPDETRKSGWALVSGRVGDDVGVVCRGRACESGGRGWRGELGVQKA
ncbi:MAG: DUF4256 domain-containing protein [Candidatus Peribacteraceae bacterium]